MARSYCEPEDSPSQSPRRLRTSTQRSLRAKIAAHVLHSKYDSRELTAPARRAATEKLNERLLAEIDPHKELPEGERARRLEHARKAHFSRLRLKGLQAKSNRSGGHG